MSLNKSKDFKSEYCATIVKIGTITPIEGTDNLATTEIEGRILVVNKHQIKEGDLRVYFSNECEICEKILHELSMYDDKTLNKDPSIKGYVSKTGRVRMIKLKGQISMGLTFPVEELVKVYPELSKFNFEENVGLDFDSVGEEKIVKAYIPRGGYKKNNSCEKNDNRFVFRITPDDFVLHYDTEQLQRNMQEFYPDDKVDISVKIHGCVEENTIVNTLEFGDKTIGEIVNDKIDCHIKAMDLEQNKIVYVPIDNHYKIPNDGEWYEIELENGRKITITGNNPIWMPRLDTYRRVEDLKENDYVLVD